MYPQNGLPQQYPPPQPGYPNAQGFFQQPGPQVYSNQGVQPQSHPVQVGYPPAQVGYPPAQAGYSPAQAGYSPAQVGYPPAQAGYHTMQPGHDLMPAAQPFLQTTLPRAQAGFPNNNFTKFNPTLKPASPFEPRKDVEKLRKAMKGFGTDEKAIIQVLARRTYEQRERIAQEYQDTFGKDLIDKLKSETRGRFRDLLVAMMTPRTHIFATGIHAAIDGIGTDEEVLIEVMCTMSSPEIAEVKNVYTTLYNTTLDNDLSGDTSGPFRKLMILLCENDRSQEPVNQESAREDAKSLYKAGEKRLGTDESVFNEIFTKRSYAQLAAIFKEYHVLAKHDIDKAIKSEFSGDIEKALLAIVKSVRNKQLFFADALHKSMKGFGTRDRQLTRIMVTRCELDLAEIANVFKMNFGKTLKSWIEGDCSGDYKKCLLALLGHHNE